MYRILKKECQEKNSNSCRSIHQSESLKPTVLFRTRSLSCCVESIMSQQHQRKTADGIVPGVRDHSCPQSSAQQREHAEHSAIRGDQQHSRNSFITMRAAKHQRGKHHADPDSPPHASELLLQVAAED